LADCVGQEDETNADPQDENAGNPEAHENAVIAVHQEPEGDAGKEAQG